MAEPLTQTILEKPIHAPAALSRLRSALPEGLRAHLRSARELDRDLKESAGEGAFPTAVPVLDRLLDGGLPRGQLVELVGARASGRFSILLAVTGTVQWLPPLKIRPCRSRNDSNCWRLRRASSAAVVRPRTRSRTASCTSSGT